VASYSALTRDVHAGAAPARDGVEDDPALRFPAGSHVGSYLHRLLERLDFQGDVASQVTALGPPAAARFGLDHQRWGADAAALLERVLATPLAPEGPRLADLPPDRRLAELEFDFSTGLTDPAALDRTLAAAAGEPLPPLGTEPFQGLVNGVIDLVFAHAGRFYLADYKSNFLGGRPEDYRPGRLAAAVRERRYDLQYLLYTLALHRYLGRRVPGYDYGRHFGGVYYLFLRGMRPETGPARGVWFTRPAREVVAAVDREVFPREGGR
jgi:exodeoxyribonuclease V beta subunit